MKNVQVLRKSTASKKWSTGTLEGKRVRAMVYNATFNNISYTCDVYIFRFKSMYELFLSNVSTVIRPNVIFDISVWV